MKWEEEKKTNQLLIETLRNSDKTERTCTVFMMIIISGIDFLRNAKLIENETELFFFLNLNRLLVVKSISFSVIIKCRIFNAFNPVQWPSRRREWNIYICCCVATVPIDDEYIFDSFHKMRRFANQISSHRIIYIIYIFILCHTLTQTVRRATWFSIAQAQFPMMSAPLALLFQIIWFKPVCLFVFLPCSILTQFMQIKLLFRRFWLLWKRLIKLKNVFGCM